jgi:hypothetical protein
MTDGKQKKPAEGTRMRAILDAQFRLIRSTDGRTFGVCHATPGRALEHGKAHSPLIQQVSKAFLAADGKWPSATAVAEVSSYAFAMASDQPAEEVPMRCHWNRDTQVLYLDVCDSDGTVIRIDRSGTRVDDAPTAFRRSRTSAPLPWPAEGVAGAADLEVLWELVPVCKADRPIVLGLLLVAWMTGTAQPIVLLVGPQDAGKTSTGRFLLSLVDPTTNERGGTMPKDEREWKARVSNTRVVLVDNLSTITAETSDLLCKVATGGEATSRALYTDDEAHISNLKVPVWLTSIDPGVLRNDLASRIVPGELEALTAERRVAESELAARQDEARPTITHGLFWLMSEVLKLWPDINKQNLEHRMGDYAIIVRCIDEVLGTEGSKRLVEHARDLAEDVIEGDPIAQILLKLVEKAEGAGDDLPTDVTTEALLERCNTLRQQMTGIGYHAGDKSWPRTPKVFSSRLMRIEPALLKAHGVKVVRRKSNGQKLLSVQRQAGSQAANACDPLRPLRPSCDPVRGVENQLPTCPDPVNDLQRVARVAKTATVSVTSLREERPGSSNVENVPHGATLATLPVGPITERSTGGVWDDNRWLPGWDLEPSDDEAA